MSSIIKNLTNKAKTEIIYPITVAEAVILNESTTLLNALDAKVDKALGKQLSQENYTTSEKSKLYSIENGAQINQNAFTKIAVIGSGDVVADQQQDTLNFVAGTNIILSTAPNSDSVIISATGTVAIAASNTSIIDAADYYTSTDVEGALQEVGYTLAHISTEASNIPLQDVGEYYAVDNVEDALQQVGYTLANLSGQAIDISVVDIGNYYTSTNVEEVLQEVGLSLGTKAPINNPVFTGTVSGITNTMVGAAAASHTHNYAGSASAGGAANTVSSPDGDRNAATKLPTTTPRQVRFDFCTAANAGVDGAYAGVMTYAPWDGTTASTGDASYQLAFGGTAANGSGVPKLNIRKGIDSTWNSWYTILHSGNVSTYAVVPRTSGNWNDGTVINNVVGLLTWKNYGNNHVIFDASNSTAPNGTAKNNTNPDVAWTGSYPTLMGWNGSQTYGVRVDRARYAEGASGDFYASGNVTAYSDERLKSNIKTIENAIDKVKSLRGVEFDKNGKHNIGVIAQEVQQVIPEVVLEADDEMKTLSVAYGNMVGLLIEAIKEQQKQIDELKALVGK